MKCPRCDFITANNRVACPRCNSSFSSVQLAVFDAAQVNFEVEEKDFSAFVAAVERKISEPIESSIIENSLDEIRTPKIEREEEPSIQKNLANQEITIDEQLWKKTEIETIRAALKNQSEPFVELNQYNTDNDIDLLFKLVEIELEDPERVGRTEAETEPSTKLGNNLGKAVYDYISEQNKKDEIKKLNIYNNKSSVRLAQIGNIIPTSISKRLLAGTIDLIICLILSSIYTWMKILPEGIKQNINNFEHNLLLELLPYSFQIIACYFAIWLIIQFITLCTFGGTFGCQLMKIAVCDTEGSLLTIRQSMLRALSWSATILTMGLGNLLIFRKQGQTLHDAISKTFVINLD